MWTWACIELTFRFKTLRDKFGLGFRADFSNPWDDASFLGRKKSNSSAVQSRVGLVGTKLRIPRFEVSASKSSNTEGTKLRTRLFCEASKTSDTSKLLIVPALVERTLRKDIQHEVVARKFGVRNACRQYASYTSSTTPRDARVTSREGRRPFCTSKCREIRRDLRLCQNAEESDAKAGDGAKAGGDAKGGAEAKRGADAKADSDAKGDGDAKANSEADYDKEVSDRILQAALPFVQQHGWSNAAISQGAETLGYAGVVHGMFPRGGFDLVNYFYLCCNEQLFKYLQLKARIDDGKNKVSSDVFEDAVRTRLQMIVPYLSRWPEAMALMSLPPNVPSSLAGLLTMVDDICYFAGDRSVNLRWYGRRVGLASVYKATELYIIQDNSPDHQDTWRFLKERLQEGEKIESVLAGSEDLSNLAKETFSATFVTARNILRLNR